MTANIVLRHVLQDGYVISKCTLHDILFKNKVWGDKALCCDALHCRCIVTGQLPVKGAPLKGALPFCVFIITVPDKNRMPEERWYCHPYLSNYCHYLQFLSLFRFSGFTV